MNKLCNVSLLLEAAQVVKIVGQAETVQQVEMHTLLKLIQFAKMSMIS